jgi:hypothetical protein
MLNNDVNGFVEGVLDCLEDNAIIIYSEQFSEIRKNVEAVIETKSFSSDVLSVIENFVELLEEAGEIGLESVTISETDGLFLSRVLEGGF